MASNDHPAVASGANLGDGARRRGPSPGPAKSQQRQPEDNKKLQKVDMMREYYKRWDVN